MSKFLLVEMCASFLDVITMTFGLSHRIDVVRYSPMCRLESLKMLDVDLSIWM